jgi:hypothetical protein
MTLFDSTFNTLFDALSPMTMGDLLTCIGISLVLGLIVAVSFQFRTPCSRSYVTTLASLPAIVCVVIMMVGGSLGVGVAVAGTFTLVRFRSMPGTAKEICAVFLSVAAGLACGVGLPLVGAILVVIMCLFNILLTLIGFGGKKNELLRKVLRITVPEDLDYSEIFTDILAEYTTQSRLTAVKTTNLGSLNKLTYEVTLKKEGVEKELIDALRCRNGNLEISISNQEINPRDL